MMPQSEWYIEVRNRPGQFLTDIFIFRRNPSGGTIAYLFSDKDICEERAFAPGENIVPSLSIPEDLCSVLMDALKRGGVRFPDESFTKGELEGTKKHLQDLRALLKLK